MAEQSSGEGSAGEMMIVGLIDHADRLGKSAKGTQQALTEQIQELAQLQQWTVNAALELQKRADAAIRNLEAERARIQGSQTNLELNAVQAIHDAVRKQSDGIERQVVQAFATPLRDIQQAAAQVRQNVKEAKWLMIGLVFAGGMVIGFALAFWPLRSTQNTMQEQLNRVEQAMTAQQPPASLVPDPKVPGQKPKPKAR